MLDQVKVPALPGAIGVTHLKVYATLAPDRLIGGSPHLHCACTEAYVVLAGHGLEAPDEQRRLGVCGTLVIYQPEGMLL